jgi:hypothetical protein
VQYKKSCPLISMHRIFAVKIYLKKVAMGTKGKIIAISDFLGY